MKPEKITTHGLLEVCELISGTRTKVTDGPYFIYNEKIGMALERENK